MAFSFTQDEYERLIRAHALAPDDQGRHVPIGLSYSETEGVMAHLRRTDCQHGGWTVDRSGVRG